MNKIRVKEIGFIICSMMLLSLSIVTIKRAIFLLVSRTNFSDHMASMVAMIILTSLLLVIAKKRKRNLSVFPTTFSICYIVATMIAVTILIATPSNFNGHIEPILLVVYSSIVTPIFEELMFRGYIWNRLNELFTEEWKTYVLTTILFGVWHVGYISSIAFRVEEGLVVAMIWKVITGLGFGLILGAIRLKTKNCYSTILLHGIMNVFGR